MNQRLKALDFIANCLSINNINNEALHNALTSEGLDWPTIINLANAQLVPTTLWTALASKGLIDFLPNDVSNYLQQTHNLNLKRNKYLKGQAIEAISCLNKAGIKPILLKGGSSLFLHLYRDLGTRIMTDLDLLVPKERAKDCWNLLRRKLDYIPVDSNPARIRAGLNHIDYSRMHHLRPLFRSGDYGTLEIHRDILPKRILQFIPTHSIWQQTESVQSDGVLFSVLSPTNRVLHNILHAFCSDLAYVRGDFPLRSLYELALLQNQYQESIDWTAIRKLMDQGGKSNELNAAMYLSYRLLANPMPDTMRPNIKSYLHYVRCRLQARWHHSEWWMDRLLWFSAQEICELYACPKDFISVTRGRIHLAYKILRNKSNRFATRWVEQ